MAEPPDNARPAIVLARYREILLEAKPPEPDRVREEAGALEKDGRWPDIDYADRTPSTWRPRQHLDRTRRLALAATHPRSVLRNDPAIRAALWRALDHWLDKRYQNPNWWHNRMGTPLLMRDILVLLEPDLSPERRTAGWQVVAQYGKVDMTGANLIWLADSAIARAAATDDRILLAQAAAHVANEIKIATDWSRKWGDSHEGIQPDFSFHQHGPRLQTFHYGGAYAHHLCRLAWILRGTPWAFPEDKVRILADYVIEGMDWMRRGAYTVPGTLCRSATRPGALGGKRLTPHLALLRDVLPDQAPRMDAIIDREAGRGKPLVGFRHFPRSDFTAYHRPDFSVFLKTVSSRTWFSEQGTNNENLKGRRLYCSDTHFMRDGQEYFNMMPVWDWFWLPGITIAAQLPEFERRSFVGGAGDGESGLAAIDYRFGDALTARKAWFCHGDRVVCLIGDLRAEKHGHGVYTALDQCRLDGPVTVGAVGEQIKAEKSATLKDVAWLHHRGVAYVLLESGQVNLTMGEATGSWQEINRGHSGATVTDQIFRPLLYHGMKSAGAAGGYLLGPAATPQAAAALAKKPGFTVLANGRDLQAVWFDDKVLMAAFYAAGSLAVGERALVKADQPCLVMVKGGKLWVANPEHKAKTVAIEIAGRPPINVSVPGDGTAVGTNLRP